MVIKKMGEYILKIPNSPSLVISDKNIVDIPFDTSGLYLIYNKHSELVYIGKSSDLRKRLLYSHFNGKDLATRDYYKGFTKVELYYINNKMDLDMLEIYMINQRMPKINKANAYFRDREIESEENKEEGIEKEELSSGNIYKYRKLSNFKSLNEFNSVLKGFYNRHKEDFTKSELVAFKELTRYAVKIYGVSNIRIGELTKSIERSSGTGISRRTVIRMLNKAKHLRILTIHTTTQEKKGGQGHNVYVFNKDYK